MTFSQILHFLESEAWELAVLKKNGTQNDPVSAGNLTETMPTLYLSRKQKPIYYSTTPGYVALILGTTTPDTGSTDHTNKPQPLREVLLSSISLSWTASTDNIIVATYDIYLDGTLKTSSATNSATVAEVLIRLQHIHFI